MRHRLDVSCNEYCSLALGYGTAGTDTIVNVGIVAPAELRGVINLAPMELRLLVSGHGTSGHAVLMLRCKLARAEGL